MEKAIFDASFFLSFLLPDEKSPREPIKDFIEGKLILVEPFIFGLEVINGLRFAFTSKRIRKEKLLKLIKSFQRLKNIHYIYDFDLEKLVKLSLKFNTSIYDACYLYVKEETNCAFYSLDEKLTKC